MSSLPSLRNTRFPSTPLWVSHRTHTDTHTPSGVSVKLSPKYTFISGLYSIFNCAFIWLSALRFSFPLALSFHLRRCWSCWRLWMQSGCGSSRLWLTVTSCWRNTKTWWRVGWSSPLRSLKRRRTRSYRASIAMVNTHIHTNIIRNSTGIGWENTHTHTHTVSRFTASAISEPTVSFTSPHASFSVGQFATWVAPQAFAFWDRGCSAWWGVLGRAINLPHTPRHITTN